MWSRTENTPWFEQQKMLGRSTSGLWGLSFPYLTILLSMLESEDHGCLLPKLGFSANPVFSNMGCNPTIYFLGSDSLLPCFPTSKVATDACCVYTLLPKFKLSSLTCYVLMLSNTVWTILYLPKLYPSDSSDWNETQFWPAPSFGYSRLINLKERCKQ